MTALLTAREVAERLRVTVVTLAKWRQRGQGPAWVKAGSAVRYDADVVQSWIAAGGDRDDA